MAKDMKLEDYVALANKDTGLVPMEHLHDTQMEFKGEIRGYSPETAEQLHDKGWCRPIALPAEEVEPVDPNQSSGGITTKDLGKQVVIPDGWETSHHLERVALAKEIAGKSQSDKMSAAEADAIINAELDRREGITA